jgi:hypothetical protein
MKQDGEWDHKFTPSRRIISLSCTKHDTYRTNGCTAGELALVVAIVGRPEGRFTPLIAIYGGSPSTSLAQGEA